MTMRVIRLIAPTLLLAATVAGCVHKTTVVEPSASPAVVTDEKTACLSTGGEWHALTHHCDRD